MLCFGPDIALIDSSIIQQISVTKIQCDLINFIKTKWFDNSNLLKIYCACKTCVQFLIYLLRQVLTDTIIYTIEFMNSNNNIRGL